MIRQAARTSAAFPRLGFGTLCVAAVVLPLLFVFVLVLPSWNTPFTFLADVPHARSAEPRAPRHGERVVFVILDGVGHDRVASSEAFADLRARGALRKIDTAFPTYTAPSITSLMTGVAPEESGVRLNGAAVGVPGLDALAESAWASGTYVRVRSRTYRPFEALARPPRGASVEPGRIRFVLDLAAMHDLPRPSDDDSARATELFIVHMGEVDEAGHAEGAASEGYARALDHAAALLTNVAAHLDETRDVLFVASDHGHRAARGHGGVEPEVLGAFFYAWGNGVRRGVALDPRPMIDVAPTVALAAGIATPSSNMGRPMLDVFDATDEARARMFAEPFDQVSRLRCALTDRACAEAAPIRAGLARGEASRIAEANALLDDLGARFTAEKEAVRTRGALHRAIFGVVGTIAIVSLLLRLRPRPAALGAVLLSLFGVYLAVLITKGYRPSLSAMTPTPIFLPDAIRALLLTLVPSALAAYTLRFGLREATACVLAPFLVLVPTWAALGADPRLVGGPVVSTLTFQLSPLGPGAAITALVALAAAAIRARRDRATARRAIA